LRKSQGGVRGCRNQGDKKSPVITPETKVKNHGGEKLGFKKIGKVVKKRRGNNVKILEEEGEGRKQKT